MKVSIVIPAHNEATTLACTLERVCAIRYPDFEVIVVDNASTDETSDIARKFPIILVREEKKGLLYAREKGRLIAKGEIIANIDADCLPEPDWLARGIEKFKNQNIVAISGPYDYYDSPRWFRTTSSFVQKYLFYILSRLMISIGRHGVLIGGNNLIRASVLKSIGGYNTTVLFYGEDTDTAKRISQKGMIVFDKTFVMKTSGRRFHTHGILKIFILYCYHFFRVTLFTKVKNDTL